MAKLLVTANLSRAPRTFRTIDRWARTNKFLIKGLVIGNRMYEFEISGYMAFERKTFKRPIFCFLPDKKFCFSFKSVNTS